MATDSYDKTEERTVDAPYKLAEPGRTKVFLQPSYDDSETQHSIEVPSQQLTPCTEDDMDERSYNQVTYIHETNTLKATDSTGSTKHITAEVPKRTRRTLEQLCERLEPGSTNL